MNYDNIIYPLDKIYSQATGVGCTVTPASVADNTPSHGEFGTLVIEANPETQMCVSYDFNVTMQCTGPMDDSVYYKFVHYFPNNQVETFSFLMEVDSEDNTKLVLRCDYDGQVYDNSMYDDDETGTCMAYTVDKTSYQETECGQANWFNNNYDE